jgi:hypothetical protein
MLIGGSRTKVRRQQTLSACWKECRQQKLPEHLLVLGI